MQLTINVADILPDDKLKSLISGIEKLLAKEGISFEIEKKTNALNDDDPWDKLDIEETAVDTGIEDLRKITTIIYMELRNDHETYFR